MTTWITTRGLFTECSTAVIEAIVYRAAGVCVCVFYFSVSPNVQYVTLELPKPALSFLVVALVGFLITFERPGLLQAGAKRQPTTFTVCRNAPQSRRKTTTTSEWVSDKQRLVTCTTNWYIPTSWKIQRGGEKTPTHRHTDIWRGTKLPETKTDII